MQKQTGVVSHSFSDGAGFVRSDSGAYLYFRGANLRIGDAVRFVPTPTGRRSAARFEALK